MKITNQFLVIVMSIFVFSIELSARVAPNTGTFTCSAVCNNGDIMPYDPVIVDLDTVKGSDACYKALNIAEENGLGANRCEESGGLHYIECIGLGDNCLTGLVFNVKD